MLRHCPAFPEHAELLIDLAVSSSAEPLSPRALFPFVAAVTTAAESFSLPAMAWPWPQPPPRLPDASQSSASTPSSSPPIHGPPEALDAASFAVPLLGHRGSPPSNPPPSGLPQARRPPLQGLRELSVRFPLSVLSFARHS